MFPSPQRGEGLQLRSRQRQCLPNRFHHAVKIFEYVVVPETDDAVAMGRKLGGSRGVGVAVGVLAAIEFDDTLSCRAGEVGDAAADRMLTAELVGQGTVAQRAPQYLFDVRRVVAELARVRCAGTDGSLRSCSDSHLTFPSLRDRPLPSPPKREERGDVTLSAVRRGTGPIRRIGRVRWLSVEQGSTKC